MSPHLMFNDMASTSCAVGQVKNAGYQAGLAPIRKSETSMEDFVSSVGFALAKTRLNSGTCHHCSLDYNDQNRRNHNHKPTNTAQTRLDSTTYLSDLKGQLRGNINRFEIMREGVFVAVVLLGRPAFRLGESISIVVDFQHSALRCHSLMAFLESSEIVDQAVALRSQASIYRATRRIYASHFELSLFERRATFSMITPSSATPSFQTSSLRLAWSLRFEFMISQKSVNGIKEEVLDQLTRNERGSVSTAVQILSCEKLEVIVPLNVSGCTPTQYLNNKIDEFSI